MLDTVKQTIPKLDRYPYVPNLSWAGTRQKRTLSGGIIGIIFIIIMLIMIVMKSITLISKDNILLKSFVKRDVSGVKFNGYEVQFVMMYYSQGQINVLDYKDYQFFGIQVLIVEVIIDYRDKDQQIIDIKAYQTMPCAASYMLCNPFIQFNPQCSYDSLDFQVCDYVKQYHVIVTNRTTRAPILDGLYPMLFVFDTKFDLYENDPHEILKKIPTTINKLPSAYGMGSNYRYLYDVPVTKLQLSVDQSILPSAISFFDQINKTQTQFYPGDKLRLLSNNQSFFLDILPTYFDFRLSRSGFTESYQRSYYRIDMMLGQIFGLIGLLSLFFALFCSGYNRWLMQIHIVSSLRDQTPTAKQQSYFSYIKQKLTCKKKQPKNNEQIQPIYYSQKTDSYQKINNNNQQPLFISAAQKLQNNDFCIDIIEMYKKIQEMSRQIQILKQQKYGKNTNFEKRQ